MSISPSVHGGLFKRFLDPRIPNQPIEAARVLARRS
jgi:hypothetical protein